MSIDFDYLIGVPNLDDTFDREASPLEDIRETSERVSSPSQTLRNILDRSPTPNLNFHPSTQGIARTGAGRSSHGCSSHRDTTPNRAKPRQPNHSLGTSEEPGRLAKTFVRPMPQRVLAISRRLQFRNCYGCRRLSPLYVDAACANGRLNIHIHGTRLDGVGIVGTEGMAFQDLSYVSQSNYCKLSFSHKAIFMCC